MRRTADPMCSLLGLCHRRVGPRRRIATGSRRAWRMCFGMFALVRYARRGSVGLIVQAPVVSGMTFDGGAIRQALLEAGLAKARTAKALCKFAWNKAEQFPSPSDLFPFID